MSTGLRVELLTAAGPYDVTDDVMGPVQVTEGRSSESGQPDPTRVALALKDHDGVYDPGNAESPLYGLIGRGTPLMVSTSIDPPGWPNVVDAFTRTVTEGWGTPDTGPTWGAFGLVGTVLPTDLSVSGGSGRIYLASAGSWRSAVVGGPYGGFASDVEVVYTVTAPSATGAHIEADVMSRYVSVGSLRSWVMARVTFSPGGAVTVSSRRSFSGVETLYASQITPLAHSGQAMRVRARFAGRMIAVKVWEAASVEPSEWSAVWHLPTLPTWQGQTLIRAGRAVGNTNSALTVLYDNVEVTTRSPRAVVEVQSWPVELDPAGALPVVMIDAAGPLRRYGSGAEVATGPLTRALTSAVEAGTGPVGYWPMEDGTTRMLPGQSWSPVVPGTSSMTIASGQTQDSLVGPLVGSLPLPQIGTAVASALVPPSAGTGGLTMWATVVVPDQVYSGEFDLLIGSSTGTAATWVVELRPEAPGWELDLKVYTAAGALILDTSGPGVPIMNGMTRIALELTQNGGNIDYVLAYVQADSLGFIRKGGTITSHTLGAWSGVSVRGSTNGPSTAVGHVTLWNSVVSVFTNITQYRGYPGETPATRAFRICSENGIPALTAPPHTTVQVMGTQPTATVPEILTDCAAVGGAVVEDRSTGAVVLAPREYLYAGGAIDVDVSWARPGDIPAATRVAADQGQFRNRVLVTRRDGVTARAEQTSGPLGTQPPPDGAGPAPVAVTLGVRTDAQAQQHADWRLRAALDVAPRIVTLTTRMHSADLPDMACLDVMRGTITITDVQRRMSRSGMFSAVPVGRAERIGPVEWTITHVLAPADPYTVWTIEDPDRGRLDTAGSELDDSIDATDTTVYVATTSGPLWTTDPAQLPMMVQIGGEPVEVTAVSGASSPQTFTVVRDPAVAAAHAGGAAVSLFRSGRVAL